MGWSPFRLDHVGSRPPAVVVSPDGPRRGRRGSPTECRDRERRHPLTGLESRLLSEVEQIKPSRGSDVKTASVHNSYTKNSKQLKTKGGYPAWARTTITISNAESVTYRVFNGLKCRIGPEKPALVHNSYTEVGLDRPESSGVRAYLIVQQI